MILSDREVRAAIARGLIGLSPCPPPDSKRWSPTTVDLTLDAELRPWGEVSLPDGAEFVDPMSPGFNSNQLIQGLTRPYDCGEGFIIQPKTLVLGWTVERLKLPHESRIAARVEGKSSLARIGLGVHVTAPTIHPGFGSGSDPSYPGSPIRLEIWSFSPLPIRLTKGMPICQLIVEEVHGTPEQGYEGQFRLQGPSSS